jgi:hypothetical protein
MRGEMSLCIWWFKNTFRISCTTLDSFSVLRGAWWWLSQLGIHHSSKGLSFENQTLFSRVGHTAAPPLPSLTSISTELQHLHTRTVPSTEEPHMRMCSGQEPRKLTHEEGAQWVCPPVLPVISFLEVPGQLAFRQDVMKRGLRTFICCKNHNREGFRTSKARKCA